MKAIRAVVDVALGLVPQWLSSLHLPANNQFQVGEHTFSFHALRAPEGDLGRFKKLVEESAPRWSDWLEKGQPPSATAVVQEGLAINWLEIVASRVNWHKALRYTTELSLRTFENAAITSNIVVSDGEGGIDIVNPDLQKLLDPLACSPQTFLRVDNEFRLISYEAVPWSKIQDAKDYKLVPELLYPFSSILATDDISIHHTSRNDLLILTRGGLTAARRKGQWRIYDPLVLMHCVLDLLKNYYVGANVFEFLLDLSFRRHGALLVYDPEHHLLDAGKIVNPGSILARENNSADSFRQALRGSVAGVRMGDANGLTGAKRLMIELASLDGALVFDDDQILAVGAMVATHPGAGGHAGARTTAARSALAYGAHPIKVSTDGDIEILFKTDDGTSVERLLFL